MAGRVLHLLERSGRYYARVVVPHRLRSILGKRELTSPLGADRREALRKLPAAVAGFQDMLASAEARLAAPTQRATPRRRSVDPIELARVHFAEANAFDEEARNADPRYATFGFVDPDYVQALEAIAAGRARNEEIASTIEAVLRKFQRRGHMSQTPGSPDWRAAARLLALAELAALDVTARRDDGEPDPPLPDFLTVPEEAAALAQREPASVGDVFRSHWRELKAAGKSPDAEKRWTHVLDHLTGFLGHDDARRITRRDAIRWKDELLETRAAKSVRDVYVAAAKAAFNTALNNDVIDANPFASVKIKVGRKQLNREKGFNDEEAAAILKAAWRYRRSTKKEHQTTADAKRWTPILAAYTGARIGELTQLRVEDLGEKDGIPFIRITPEAGTVKTATYRDVPLHPHLVELGFVAFAKAKGRGALFYRPSSNEGALPFRVVADRVGKWVRGLQVADTAVAPNHGWRHRVKTIGREAKIDSRVLDAIQGHAPRTAGDDYGDVTLVTKHRAILTLPRYRLE